MRQDSLLMLKNKKGNLMASNQDSETLYILSYDGYGIETSTDTLCKSTDADCKHYGIKPNTFGFVDGELFALSNLDDIESLEAADDISCLVLHTTDKDKVQGYTEMVRQAAISFHKRKLRELTKKDVTQVSVDILNDLLKDDPEAAADLMRISVYVSEKTANHPHITVRDDADVGPVLGVLGIVNGILSANGDGLVQAHYDDSNVLTKFERHRGFTVIDLLVYTLLASVILVALYGFILLGLNHG